MESPPPRDLMSSMAFVGTKPCYSERISRWFPKRRNQVFFTPFMLKALVIYFSPLHSVDSILIDVTCSVAFGASGGSGLAPGFIAGTSITRPTTSTR